MRHLDRRRGLGLGVLVLVLLALVAAVTAPDGAVPDPEVVPVSSTELVCPDARTSSTNSVYTGISAVTPSTLAVGTSGAATVGTPAKPTSIATVKGNDHGVVKTAPAGTGAVVGRALLGRAPGFAMDQLTVSSRAGDHGLAGVTCTEPDNDVWFVGTGSAVGHASALYLSDTESTPATVDIALFGRNGQVDAPGGQGILVKGNARRVIRLDQLAPGAGELAVHVTASSGRVSAAVLDTEVNGLIPEGADWVPVSEPPADRVVIPGLGSGQGTRKLSIYAPGEGTSTVKVTLVGKSGAFAPSGAASVDIDRGKVTTVDLGTAVKTDDTAAVLEADVPIVAGVRWSYPGAKPDVALTAGVSALTAPAVVAGNRIDGGYGTSLMLTAPDGAAKVSIQPLTLGAPAGKPTVVSVGAARTVRLTMPGTKGWFETVITPLPGSGPLYGAVLRSHAVDGGAGLTISVIRNARISAAVPAAEPDLDVGLGH